MTPVASCPASLQRRRLPTARLTALQQLRAEKKVRRSLQLLIGLFGYGAAVALLVRSSLGAGSWNVLSEGVAARTGLSFGWATNLTALGVMVFWIPLKELPGVGTLLNILLVGVSADAVTRVLPAPHSFASGVQYYAAGIVLLAFFDALYLGARFGSGPRDGLMTGAVRVTGLPVWAVRMAIDTVVVTVGWTLGGAVGAGTLVAALLMGPLVHAFLRLTTVRLRYDG